jgi:RNA polymerase sigma factor (sigma-70 family)
VNALARRKVRADFAGREATRDGAAETVSAVVDARAQLLRALDRLDDRQREVVLLHDLEGCSHGEIAEALGVSEVNSRQLLFTARKVMRDELETKETDRGP